MPTACLCHLPVELVAVLKPPPTNRTREDNQLCASTVACQCWASELRAASCCQHGCSILVRAPRMTCPSPPQRDMRVLRTASCHPLSALPHAATHDVACQVPPSNAASDEEQSAWRSGTLLCKGGWRSHDASVLNMDGETNLTQKNPRRVSDRCCDPGFVKLLGKPASLMPRRRPLLCPHYSSSDLFPLCETRPNAQGTIIAGHLCLSESVTERTERDLTATATFETCGLKRGNN